MAHQRFCSCALPSVQGLKVHINALLNDTVATLAAARYLDGPDAIGSVIMGTGKTLSRACTVTSGLPGPLQNVL